MKKFTFTIPQQVICGEGSFQCLPELARKLGGKKACIISGPHLRKIGLVDQCRKALLEAGIDSGSFTETEGNPCTTTVEKARDCILTGEADFIVALGGAHPLMWRRQPHFL